MNLEWVCLGTLHCHLGFSLGLDLRDDVCVLYSYAQSESLIFLPSANKGIFLQSCLAAKIACRATFYYILRCTFTQVSFARSRFNLKHLHLLTSFDQTSSLPKTLPFIHDRNIVAYWYVRPEIVDYATWICCLFLPQKIADSQLKN